MSLLIIVVVATLVISCLCSLFEATLFSTRTTALEAARDQGLNAAGARKFLRLKRNIAAPTSAILILNTVANTAGATVAGILARDALGVEWIPVFSVGLTLGILFLSEILPKTYGATHWRSLWGVVVWPIVAIERLLRPLSWVTQKFAALFVGAQSGPTTTEDEILAMIRMGAMSGELSATELRLITRVFQFDEMEVGDVVLPRGDVVYLDLEWPVARCLEVVRESKHARYPLCRGSLDALVGFVHIKDLFGLGADDDVDLASLARPLPKVPETMRIPRLLRRMQAEHPHIAAVVDERGTLVGLVTLEDVLEQIVGAVQDEFDSEPPELVTVGAGAYDVMGRIPISRLNAELGLTLPNDDASTLSGLLVARAGRLLRPGDAVKVGRVTAAVLDVRGDRAGRVRLTLGPEPEPDAAVEAVEAAGDAEDIEQAREDAEEIERVREALESDEDEDEARAADEAER